MAINKAGNRYKHQVSLFARCQRYFRQQTDGIVLGWHCLRRKPFSSALAAVLLSLVLVLLMFLMSVLHFLQPLQRSWEQGLTATVFFQQNINESQVLQIKSQWESLNTISQAERLSTEQIYQELQVVLGDNSSRPHDALADISIFPEIIELQFNTEKSLEQIKVIQEQILSNPAVERIVVDNDWYERVSALQLWLERLFWVIMSFLTLVVMAVVATLIQNRVAERREEIQIHRLLGASRTYVCMPYIYMATFLLLGAITLSCLWLFITQIWLSTSTAELKELYGLTSFGAMEVSLNIKSFLKLWFVCLFLAWITAWIASIRCVDTDADLEPS